MIFFQRDHDKPTSQDELPTRVTTNLQEVCVFVADHSALKDHLESNQIQQSELDRYLLRGLRLVQQKKRELSHVAQALTILLQFGAIWNSDDLLDDQQTPYHIICQSSGDHHEFLNLMIQSSQQTIIDAQDKKNFAALHYAVRNDNINCVKCLIANGANVYIETERYSEVLAAENKPRTPIMIAMWRIKFVFPSAAAIRFDIIGLLLDAAFEQNKDHFRSCTDYILYALYAGNVKCIKELINVGAPLDIIADDGRYVWTRVTRMANVELLTCMFNHDFNMDFIDQHGVSVLEHVVNCSRNIEAVRYMLDIGVTIPTLFSEST